MNLNIQNENWNW